MLIVSIEVCAIWIRKLQSYYKDSRFLKIGYTRDLKTTRIRNMLSRVEGVNDFLYKENSSLVFT